MAPQPDRDGDPLARHALSPGELKELLEVERVGAPFFVFREGDGSLRFLLARDEDRPRTIGRRAETDLPIGWDPEVSGLHAELQGTGGEWAGGDDGHSTNGTFVNGERVGGRRRLRDGDRIRVGKTILAYKAGGGQRLQETVPAGEGPAPQELTEAQRRVLVALCRPYRDRGSFTAPATNQQIADEVFLSVDAVKMHLRTLFGKFELTELPQNQKRLRLAETALQFGVVTQRDLD